MKTPIRNHEQDRVTEGKQIVILDQAQTAETDELDPEFSKDNDTGTHNDPGSELI